MTSEQFNTAVHWLSTIDKDNSISRKYNSYALSKLVERSSGIKVSNECFIAAATHCGFRHVAIPGNDSVYFAISEASVALKVNKALKREVDEGKWNHMLTKKVYRVGPPRPTIGSLIPVLVMRALMGIV